MPPLLQDPVRLGFGAVVVVGSLGMLVLFIWMVRKQQQALRLKSLFFDAALAWVDGRLQELAGATGGVYRRGLTSWLGFTKGWGQTRNETQRAFSMFGLGSTVTCSFRGFEVELSPIITQLESTLALMPRIIVRLPAGQRWQRLASQQTYALFFQGARLLWSSQVDGERDFAIATLTPSEQVAFDALVVRCSCVYLTSERELEARASPGQGIGDVSRTFWRDDFARADLDDLVQRVTAFAAAAAAP